MNRPYIVCHMVMSVDGKVTGDFLFRPECEKATDVYYEINRELKADGFICGRVTMESSFTNGWYPDLSKYEPTKHSTDIQADFIPDDEHMSGFYAVAFDPKGKLGWKSNKIADEDPGYDDAQIIEVLTSKVDTRYLEFLRATKIPYIFAGENEIDIEQALFKLKALMGINTLLLEGGSVVNGYFERTDTIDELSLVVAPTVAEANDKPLFYGSIIADYKLKEVKRYDNDIIWMNYINTHKNK